LLGIDSQVLSDSVYIYRVNSKIMSNLGRRDVGVVVTPNPSHSIEGNQSEVFFLFSAREAERQ
jgi:hypothetical protein